MIISTPIYIYIVLTNKSTLDYIQRNDTNLTATSPIPDIAVSLVTVLETFWYLTIRNQKHMVLLCSGLLWLCNQLLIDAYGHLNLSLRGSSRFIRNDHEPLTHLHGDKMTIETIKHVKKITFFSFCTNLILYQRHCIIQSTYSPLLLGYQFDCWNANEFILIIEGKIDR